MTTDASAGSGSATAPESARARWEELPPALRGWAEQLLGGPVVSAVTAPGGFSVGAACRLRTRRGQRAFLKAVSTGMNPRSTELQRREAHVTRLLEHDPAVPAVLGVYDAGDWAGLLLTEVDGRLPPQPWQPVDLERVLAALAALHDRHTPAPEAGLPGVGAAYGDVLTGWRRLAAQPPPGLDAWSRRHLDRLAEVEAGWAGAADGGTLLHGDLRADNLLFTADRVVFLDWPWACVGAAWFDVVAFAPSVAAQGGPDPEWLLARTPRARAAAPEAVTAVAVAVAGYFTEQASRPAPAGLRNPRTFQDAQARAARSWLRHRTGWT